MRIFLAVSSFMNAGAAMAIGVIAYMRNPRNTVYRTFGLLALAVSGWATSYAIWILASAKHIALFWLHSLVLTSTFVPIFFLHWIISWLQLKKKHVHITVKRDK